MESGILNQFARGARVKVTQQIAGRDRTWVSEVRGTVVRFDQKPTGSWFAHSRDDRLWLDRLVLRKEDGEQTTLILDDYSHVEIEPALKEPPAAESADESEPAEPAGAGAD